MLQFVDAWVVLKNASGFSGRILFLLCLLFPLEVGAQTLIEALAAAERQSLATDPTWLRLLHYERGSDQSVLLADDFFLAASGRSDPQAELHATLRAYFDTRLTWDDGQPRCRFPARYYWLASKLDLPGYELRAPGCAQLEDWALFDQTKSISLLLVSGYLGNPASTFGHSLLRFNSDVEDDSTGLFDLALNYGALVPENENPLLYIFRGLTGSYKAGFSDKYYYTQDLVYSRTEFRDMWDYRLNLTEFQRTLMILHVWEIVGKKFKYYFLDKNCGYRIAELLELVVDEVILEDVGRWYAPVALFHRMNEIDADRARRYQPSLVQSVRYVPSSRRKLYSSLAHLSDDEMDALNEYIDAEPDALGGLIAPFDEARRSVVLDGMLAYQQYRLSVDRPDSVHVDRQKKDAILLARLQLPPRPRVKALIPSQSSPADGFRPSELSLAASRGSNGFEYATLGWAPFIKESVGQNSLEGNELAFLDLALGVADDAPALFLERLDVIRILSLNRRRSRLRGHDGLSWRLRIGVDRERVLGSHDYDGVFNFGAGRAWSWGRRLTPFALLNVQTHTDSPHARVMPEVGLLTSFGSFRAMLEYSVVSTDYEGETEDAWRVRGLYRLGSRHSIHVSVRDRRSRVGSLGVSRYF